MKIAFTTLGCKVNQFDTAIMSEGVAKENHQVVSYDEEADLYVINTCTVTENADLESRHWVNKARKRNPEAKIIVTGCYAQTNPSEVKKIPGVNLIIGNEEKKALTAFLHVVNTPNDQPVSCVGDIAREKLFKQPLIETFLDKTRAFLKVQDGCNSWCSFCIIPKARGRSRSFSLEEVTSQVRLFEEMGYREVVFSGINLGSYGMDFHPKSSLLALFKKVEKETQLIRFRFSSIEPELLSEPLIDALTESPRVCRHFHIPLQSGDAEVLKKMGRKYTLDEYQMKIEKIHRQAPEASIGADVMVGFPGESPEAFRNSYRFVSELPLSYLHVFPYSIREGTSAADFAEEVSLQEKTDRARRLRELNGTIQIKFKSKFVGRPLKVIIEGFDENDPSREIKGLSDNFLKLTIEGADHLKQNDEAVVIPSYFKGEKLIGKLES